MQLASNMPEELDARAELLASAKEMLARADRIDPRNPLVLECRGFYAYLNQHYAQAATLYLEAARHAEPGQRPGLIAKGARMHLAAGDAEAALATTAKVSDRPTITECVRAKALIKLGRSDDANTLLAELEQRNASEIESWVELGSLYELNRNSDGAERLYRLAIEQDPIANYFLARLKAKSGEIDSSLDCLERAAAANAAWVRVNLERDAPVWVSCSGHRRFQTVQGNQDEAAQPGR